MTRIFKALKYGFIVVFLVGLAAFLMPTQTRSVSNLDGYDELEWRQLTPTTPAAEVVSAVQPPGDTILVVDHGTVYELERTPDVMRLLFIATRIGVTDTE